MNNNNIPGSDSKFDDFQSNFISTVSTNQVAWGLTPIEIAELTGLQAPWTAIWLITKNPDNRTRAQVNAKVLARKNLTVALRSFIRYRIYGNPLMTDADRLLCGVKPYDSVRTPVPVPNSVPVLSMVNKGTNEMALYFNQPKGEDGSSRRGKPKGAIACIIAVLRGSYPGPTPPPPTPDNFPERHILTRSPKKFINDPGSAGQTMYIFACWVNGKGEQGPWTDLNTFII